MLYARHALDVQRHDIGQTALIPDPWVDDRRGPEWTAVYNHPDVTLPAGQDWNHFAAPQVVGPFKFCPPVTFLPMRQAPPNTAEGLSSGDKRGIVQAWEDFDGDVRMTFARVPASPGAAEPFHIDAGGVTIQEAMDQYARKADTTVTRDKATVGALGFDR